MQVVGLVVAYLCCCAVKKHSNLVNSRDSFLKAKIISDQLAIYFNHNSGLNSKHVPCDSWLYGSSAQASFYMFLVMWFNLSSERVLMSSWRFLPIMFLVAFCAQYCRQKSVLYTDKGIGNKGSSGSMCPKTWNNNEGASASLSFCVTVNQSQICYV